jgi:hypothetical protein
MGGLLLAFLLAGCDDREREPQYRFVPERSPIIALPEREATPELDAKDMEAIPEAQRQKVAKIIVALVNRVEALENSIKRYNAWSTQNNIRVDEFLAKYNSRAKKPETKPEPKPAPKPLPERAPVSDTPVS